VRPATSGSERNTEVSRASWASATNEVQGSVCAIYYFDREITTEEGLVERTLSKLNADQVWAAIGLESAGRGWPVLGDMMRENRLWRRAAAGGSSW